MEWWILACEKKDKWMCAESNENWNLHDPRVWVCLHSYFDTCDLLMWNCWFQQVICNVKEDIWNSNVKKIKVKWKNSTQFIVLIETNTALDVLALKFHAWNRIA